MYNTKETKVTMKGMATVEVELENNNRLIVTTLCQAPAIRIDDWQSDGGFWHNEGGYDIDLINIKPVYPDEYTYQGTNKFYNSPIKKIIRVIDDELEEVT